MGSDGLFDNVYDLEIENTLRVFTIYDQESAQCCGGCFTSLLSSSWLTIFLKLHTSLRRYKHLWYKGAIMVHQSFHAPWYDLFREIVTRVCAWCTHFNDGKGLKLQHMHWQHWQARTQGTLPMNPHTSRKLFSRLELYVMSGQARLPTQLFRNYWGCSVAGM